MSEQDLIWIEKSKKLIAKCAVFDIYSSLCQSKDGMECDFFWINAPDWVTVVPILKIADNQEEFLMVKQFRHGSKQLYTEFPAGIMDPGEKPEEAALRELQEETGYTGRLTLIGKVNPNPALFNNTKYTFLAEDLVPHEAGQCLDETEKLLIQKMNTKEVGRYVGIAPEFSHAMTVQAYFFFLRHRQQLIY
ncbi:MAG: NUDIX hydrolase [Spirochaetia bacterium]